MIDYRTRKVDGMDPNAAAAIMRDAETNGPHRLAAARDLLAWLERGGYPQSIPGRSFGGNTAAKLAALDETESYIRTLEG
jgi:hypothetical protein